MSHVFLSYVKEDLEEVQLIALTLRACGVDVWLDRRKLRAGSRYKSDIRTAIRSGAFFIAFFSKAWGERQRSFVNEELTNAIEELRQRPTDRAWFIPVRLNDCEIPDRPIGAGETLRDLQWVDMFPRWLDGLAKIGEVIAPEKFAPLIVEQTWEGEVITGNHVQLSSAESTVLFRRYIKYLKKFGRTKSFDHAHHLAILWAFRETYDWFDEREIEEGTSELARKLELFAKYLNEFYFDMDLGVLRKTRRGPSTRVQLRKPHRGS